MAKKWALTTGSSPGGAYETTTYTDVETWSVAEAANLVSAGESYHLSAFDDWATGLDAASEEVRNTHGWTTSSTNKVILDVYPGEGHGGVVGAGFIVDVNTSVYGAIRPVYVHIDITGWQFIFSASASALHLQYAYGGNVDCCILDMAGNTGKPGIDYSDNSSASGDGHVVSNCLFLDGYRGNDNIYKTINCTFDGQSSYAFLWRGHASRQAFNNVFTNSAGVYDEPSTGTDYDYQYTDETSAYGTNSVANITPADQYTDIASEDYSVKDTDADIYDSGNDLSGTYPQLAYDIAGNARSSTYSIGAYEYVSAGGGVTVDLTGLSSATAVGTLSVDTEQSVSVPLTGLSSTTALGTITVSTGTSVQVDLTGLSSTTAIGTLTVDSKQNVSVELIDVSSITAVGTLTATVGGGVAVGLTTTVATGAVGTLTVTGEQPVTVDLTGISSTTAIGTLSVSTGTNVSVTPAGVAATTALGTLAVATEQQISYEFSGVAATAAVGTLAITVPTAVSLELGELAATGYAGTLGVTTEGNTWNPVSPASTIWTDISSTSTTWAEI